MRFFSSVALLGFVSSALGQSIAIGFPTEGASINPGSSFMVEVDRPDTLTGSSEVAIAISLQSCPGGNCISPADFLGRTLYSGPYTPDFHTGVSRPPHQNFSVAVPDNFAKGKALLSVCHFSLVGAGPFPLFEIKNVTLDVV